MGLKLSLRQNGMQVPSHSRSTSSLGPKRAPLPPQQASFHSARVRDVPPHHQSARGQLEFSHRGSPTTPTRYSSLSGRQIFRWIRVEGNGCHETKCQLRDAEADKPKDGKSIKKADLLVTGIACDEQSCKLHMRTDSSSDPEMRERPLGEKAMPLIVDLRPLNMAHSFLSDVPDLSKGA